ncbi:SDR family oxidoreductase [Pseudonocardia xishanensis]|uniref:Ketoreductase domain-containing protein n=1 Tax=Pseudonocardia xishanensis TaxID=630995 RepID=A0ABP8RXX6_9PSEU
MNDLTGLVVVVTGGNGGIGLGMATGIAKAGGAVAIWARDAAKSDQAVRGLTELGARAIALTCDVTDEAQVEAAMEQTVAELGPLGCLVSNAGTSDGAPLVDTSLAAWRRVHEVNLDGAFLTCREAARRFAAQGTGGSIVVVSSMISRYGSARQAAYASSKTALLGLSRTLAVELARHRVRCNALIPGWTRTDLSAAGYANERFRAATTARTPVRAVGGARGVRAGRGLPRRSLADVPHRRRGDARRRLLRVLSSRWADAAGWGHEVARGDGGGARRDGGRRARLGGAGLPALARARAHRGAGEPRGLAGRQRAAAARAGPVAVAGRGQRGRQPRPRPAGAPAG